MDFYGVKMVVTQFVMQATNVSRHFGMFRENCFKKVVSDLPKKFAYMSTKLLLEKSAKKVQKKKKL